MELSGQEGGGQMRRAGATGRRLYDRRRTTSITLGLIFAFLQVLVLATTPSVQAGENERTSKIKMIIAENPPPGFTLKSRVPDMDGVVERLEENPNNTYTYVLKDDWGYTIRVIATTPPPTAARYVVDGVINRDGKGFFLTELARHPEAPPPDPRLAEFDRLVEQAERFVQAGRYKESIPVLQKAITIGQAISPAPTRLSSIQTLLQQAEAAQKRRLLTLYGLIAGVIVVAGMLAIVLRTRQRSAGQMLFPANAMITVVDKTQKVTAPVAAKAAIDDGTVKVLPGRFEIKGGVDLKEIRLFRPRNVPDHQIEYTFGRLPGDRFRHVQLGDPTVSSQQARLKYGKDGYSLINLPDPADPERNATLLNGVAMGAHEGRPLKDGDTIRMGNVELVYHAE
jgi:hypothetical protein